METLESSRVCRLCGKHSGISINIFDKNENHVRKINAVLPIMVHEMDLLPKHMCHRCSYKLEEFHKFYVDCLRTDADLKSQLSWMNKEESKERTGVPMVQIGNVKIKSEPLDYEVYELDRVTGNFGYINSMNSMTLPMNGMRKTGLQETLPYATYARCGCLFKKDQNRTNSGKVYRKIGRGAVSRNHATAAKVETPNDVLVNPAQVVKKNPFSRCTAGNQTPNTLARDSRNGKSSTETKETLSTLSGNNLFEGNKFPSPFSVGNGSTARNLRPRKESVDYVGTRKKSSIRVKDLNIRSKSADGKEVTLPASTECNPVVQVKIEPLDGIEGRLLRPRTKVVDYRGKKRKVTSLTVNQVRSKSEEIKRPENGANGSWLPVMKKENPCEEERLNFSLKEERPFNNDATLLTSQRGHEIKTRAKLDVTSTPRKIDALPNNVLIKVEDNILEYAKSSNVQTKDDYHLNGELKSLVRGRKPGKANAKRKAKPHFPLKYLRSHDAHLRNGKVKKLENMDLSVKKLRRSWQHIVKSNKTTGKNFFKAIKENGCVKNGMGTEKLIDIKHYCEKCSMTFANKELYRLHACYYD